jgi:SPP1 gp7 family putative phage head morphogenesis protein
VTVAKPNKVYWQDRFVAVEEMRNKAAKETVQAVTPAFDKAQAQIEKEINAWYGRFAKNNEISLQEAKKLLNSRELKEFRWDVQEYIKYGRQNALDQKWMKELENASARFHISRLEALKIRTQNAAERAFGNELDQIDEMATRIYMDDYYHTAYEIQKGLGIGWDVSQIDQRKLDRIISRPWTTDKMTFSDRIWKSKAQLIDSLHKELTQMCVLGKAPDQTISAIAKRMNVSKGQAGRLVMTEAAYFGSVAQKDCLNDLDVEKYEVVATLDNRTSDTCQEMDGKVFDMKDFEAGVTAPPFHVWCRSCTCPWFEDNDDGTRIARGADGKTYQVPANMKYSDWVEYFVDKTKDPADWLKLASVDDIVKMGFPEKIQEIRDRITQNGSVTEDDLQEAGKLFQEELLNDKQYSERIQKMDDLAEKQKTAHEEYMKLNDKFLDMEADLPFSHMGLADDLIRYRKGLAETPNSTFYKEGLERLEARAKDVDPKYFELHKKKCEAYEKYQSIRQELNSLQKTFAFDNAEDVKRVLSQIREMGSDGIDIKKHLNNSRSPMRKEVEKAYSYYPTDWVKASVKRGNLTPKKVDRGYYSDWRCEIAISGYGGESTFKTCIHELGHRMERAVPEIKKAEKVFYDRRTAGENLEWLGGGYARTEVTRKDNFLNPYMGKDYNETAYELVSMGFEYGYTDPAHLMKDADMANWIYGILTLF